MYHQCKESENFKYFFHGYNLAFGHLFKYSRLHKTVKLNTADRGGGTEGVEHPVVGLSIPKHKVNS